MGNTLADAGLPIEKFLPNGEDEHMPEQGREHDVVILEGKFAAQIADIHRRIDIMGQTPQWLIWVLGILCAAMGAGFIFGMGLFADIAVVKARTTELPPRHFVERVHRLEGVVGGLSADMRELQKLIVQLNSMLRGEIEYRTRTPGTPPVRKIE